MTRLPQISPLEYRSVYTPRRAPGRRFHGPLRIQLKQGRSPSERSQNKINLSY